MLENVVNDGTNAFPAADSSTVYFLNAASKANEVLTNCWWVSGGFNPPHTYQATFRQTLSFSNGQQVEVECAGVFHMYRPKATISAITPSPVTVTGNVIRFGTAGMGLYGAGIVFDHTLVIPANSAGSIFAGTNEWIQVDYTTPEVFKDINAISYSKVQNGPAPFGDYPIPFGELYTDTDSGKRIPFDSPHTVLPASGFVHYEASDDFKMWMMFKPSGGNIVPLNVVSWHWHGIATNSGVGTWGLASDPGDHSDNPEGAATEEYPLWKSNLRRFHWNPANAELPQGQP